MGFKACYRTYWLFRYYLFNLRCYHGLIKENAKIRLSLWIWGFRSWLIRRISRWWWCLPKLLWHQLLDQCSRSSSWFCYIKSSQLWTWSTIYRKVRFIRGRLEDFRWIRIEVKKWWSSWWMETRQMGGMWRKTLAYCCNQQSRYFLRCFFKGCTWHWYFYFTKRSTL